MKVTFYPRGSMIQARISDGAKVNYRLSTGIKLPRHLKFAKEKFLGNTAEANVLNTELDRHKLELKELYLRYGKLETIKNAYNHQSVSLEEEFEEGNFDLHNLLREYIHLAAKGKITTKSGKKITDGTVRVYRNVVNLYAQYEQIYGGIDLSEYIVLPNMTPMQRKRLKDQYQSYFNRFDQFMSKQGLLFNTRCNNMNTLSIMMNYWISELCLSVPKFVYQAPKINPIVVFEPEFIADFTSDKDKFYDTLTPQLKYTWEICTTILFTTLRIQDALDLAWKDFQVTKDKMYMTKINKKVGTSQAPLPPKLADVYRMNMAKYGRIYSMPKSRRIVYDNIKNLFKLYEPMHEFVNIRKFGVNGEEKSDIMRFYEAVHPHMLRKSAITAMLTSGLDERTVKNLSGHGEKSASFERYVGFVQKHFNGEIEDYYQKMSVE